MADLTIYFSQDTVVPAELKDTLTLLNYPEQLGTADLFLDYLSGLENGETDKHSHLKLRKLKQLQQLFEYQFRKLNPDGYIMQKCILAIKFLLGGYLKTSIPIITESVILSDLTSGVTFNIQTTGNKEELIKLTRTANNLIQDVNNQWYLPLLTDTGYPFEAKLIYVIYNGLSLPGAQLDTTVIPNRIYGFANNETATIDVLPL